MNGFRSAFAVLALAFAAQGFAQTRELPDFTRLVEEQGPAVVNISTTQQVRRQAAFPQVPGLESEEGQEFFRRFLPRSAARPAGAAPGEPLARLRLHRQQGRLHPDQRPRGRGRG